MQIKHIKHNEIDFRCWDETIVKASNQLIYAYSWFLDIVSPNWEALITENYEYVMPLPIKRKYGVSYLVQPPQSQQLGVFSAQSITTEVVNQFIHKIPTFSYEINLNEQNFVHNALEQPNFVLNLNSSYDELCQNYSKNTQRNLSKAKLQNLKLSQNIDFDEFWEFNSSLTKKYNTPHQNILKQLIEKGIRKKSINIFGIYSIDHKLIAALCTLVSGRRITYFLPRSNDIGKTTSAMFLLIDALIKLNCQQEVLLDFEGSRIEGIARFYKGFGAKNHPYYTLKRNRPTFLIGKLKTK